MAWTSCRVVNRPTVGTVAPTVERTQPVVVVCKRTLAASRPPMAEARPLRLALEAYRTAAEWPAAVSAEIVPILLVMLGSQELPPEQAEHQAPRSAYS